MKRIMITGGSGFIGRNLREALAANYEIFAPTHGELNIMDYPALEKYVFDHRIEVIIHGAVHVPMVNGPLNEFFNDMLMFANLAKISQRIEKLLYFGSGAEFDKRYDISMVREEDLGKTVPVSEYGLAKYTMNMLARPSSNIYNLRLFGIFGKYERWNYKFISGLCCKAVMDLPLTVRRDCYFDFFSVEDLPEIVRWFIENTPDYHDYNVVYGQQFRLTEFAEMVREVSGKELPIRLLYEDRNVDYSADNTRLRRQIPDLHITPMKEALLQLYNYYEQNRDMLDKDELIRAI